jgi:hypothetical protein
VNKKKQKNFITLGLDGAWIMSDHLVLDLLRAIRGDITEIKTDVVALKERIGLLEGATASVSRRVDRIGGDVEQIKRRLDLVSS